MNESRLAEQQLTFDERSAKMADDARRAIYSALLRGNNVTINFIPAVYSDHMTMRSCMFIDRLFAGDAHHE